MADECVYWDRLEIEDLIFPDGPVDRGQIPTEAWDKHREKHARDKDRYGILDQPSAIEAAAGLVMVGYRARPGTEIQS